MSTKEVVQYSLCEDHHHHIKEHVQNIGCMTSFLHHILDRIQILTGRRLRRHKRISSNPSDAPPSAPSTPQTSSTTGIPASTTLQIPEEEPCKGQCKKSSSLITDKKHDLLQPLHEVDETFSNDDNPVEEVHKIQQCSSKASDSGNRGVGAPKSKEAFLKSSRSLQERRHGNGLEFGRDCKEPRRFSTSCGLDHLSHPSSTMQGQLLDIRDIVRACIFKEPVPCTSVDAEHRSSKQRQTAPPSVEKQRKSWKYSGLERKETSQLSGNVSSDEMETDEDHLKPGSSSMMTVALDDANVCKQSIPVSECRESGKKNPDGEDIITASAAPSSSYSSDTEETPRNASANMQPFPNAEDPSSSCNRLKARHNSRNVVARLMGLEEMPAGERPTQLSSLQVYEAPSPKQETQLNHKTTSSNHRCLEIARQLQVGGVPMMPFAVEMLTASLCSSSLPLEILDVGDVHDTLLNTLQADRVQLQVEKQKHQSPKEECTLKESCSQQSLSHDCSNSMYKDLDMVLQDLKHNPTHHRQDLGRLIQILEEIRASSSKKALPNPGEMSPRFQRGNSRPSCGSEEDKPWRKCLFPEKEYAAGRRNSWQPQPTGNVEDREGTSSKLATTPMRCSNSHPSGCVMGRRVGSKMLDQDQCTSTLTRCQLNNANTTYSIKNGIRMSKRRIQAATDRIPSSAHGPSKEEAKRAIPLPQYRNPAASSQILMSNRTMESKAKLNKQMAKSLSPALDALHKAGSTAKLRTGGSILTVTPEPHHCLSLRETKEEPAFSNVNRNIDTFCVHTESCLELNMRTADSEENKHAFKLEQSCQQCTTTTAAVLPPQILSGGDINKLLRAKEVILVAEESNAKRCSVNDQPSPVSVLDQDVFSSSCEDSSPTTDSFHPDLSRKQISENLDEPTDFCVVEGTVETRVRGMQEEERVILSSSEFEDNASGRCLISPLQLVRVDPKLLCHLINELVVDKMQHSTLFMKAELPWMMAMANDLRSSSSSSQEAEYNTVVMSNQYNNYSRGPFKERLAKNVRQEVEKLLTMASTNPDEAPMHLLEWDITESGWQWNTNMTPSSLVDITVAIECSIFKALLDEIAQDVVQIMQHQKCGRLTAIRRQLF